MELLIDQLISDESNFRYERKYCIRELSDKSLENLLRFHSVNFKEIYQKRFINNIYFDTHSLDCYWDNLNGKSNRLKVRIRWYGDFKGVIQSPCLEIKIKKANRGYKFRYPLGNFTIDNNLAKKQILKLFEEAPIPEFLQFYLKDLQIALLNRYQRKYYLSFNKKCRVTLDTKMNFYYFNEGRDIFSTELTQNNENEKILEFKYDAGYENNFREISDYSPFRLSRYSKYISGIEKVGI